MGVPSLTTGSKPDVIELIAAALADRYLMGRELGRGGMATVYLAEDLRHVALKVLRAELSTALAAERFTREIAVAARLNYPHILPLLDSGAVESPGARPVLFYAMPYVESGTLRERLRAELQLPLAEAATLAGQVAEALDHAHTAGAVGAYRHYLVLRDRPNPGPMREQVDRVRAHLAELVGEPRM